MLLNLGINGATEALQVLFRCLLGKLNQGLWPSVTVAVRGECGRLCVVSLSAGICRVDVETSCWCQQI